MTREPMTLAPLSRACAALSPQVQSQSEWPLVLIRIYLSSGYFTSGMCKVLCGLRFSRYWGKGPTLQMYIYDSMWSRPAGPRVRALQQLMLTSPRMLTLLATSSASKPAHSSCKIAQASPATSFSSTRRLRWQSWQLRHQRRRPRRH